jgi:hypothetical protein
MDTILIMEDTSTPVRDTKFIYAFEAELDKDYLLHDMWFKVRITDRSMDENKCIGVRALLEGEVKPAAISPATILVAFDPKLHKPRKMRKEFPKEEDAKEDKPKKRGRSKKS